MNKVFLNGYLARDPQSRVTSKGLEQANITVAVNDIKNNEQTYFISCVAWGTSAKYANAYLKKGNFVAIDGRLSNRSYVASDGQTKYVTEVIIDNIRNFGSKSSSTDYKPVENKASARSIIDEFAESAKNHEDESSSNSNMRVDLDEIFGTKNHTSSNENINEDDEELEWDDDI